MVADADDAREQQIVASATDAPLAGESSDVGSGPRRVSVHTASGGEIQLNEYLPGQSPSFQDEIWDSVAYESSGGFHYPREDLSPDFVETVMAREAKRANEYGRYGEDFIADVQVEMLAISASLAEIRRRHAVRPTLISRVASAVGMRQLRRRAER